MLTVAVVYNVFFWPIAIAAFIKGAFTYNWALTRLSMIAVTGEAIMRLYDFTVSNDYISALSPGSIYLAIYAAQCFLATVKPPSKYCAVGGGVFLAGGITSVVYILFRKGYDADVIFWYNNVIIGWVLILVLLWGLVGDGMWRFFSGLFRRVFSLVARSRSHELAKR